MHTLESQIAALTEVSKDKEVRGGRRLAAGQQYMQGTGRCGAGLCLECSTMASGTRPVLLMLLVVVVVQHRWQH